MTDQLQVAWDAEAIIKDYFSITDTVESPSLERFFDESCVMVLPFRPAPGARRYDGLDVLREIFKIYPRIYRTLNNLNVTVHRCLDPLEAFVYWSSDHELVNGYRYKNDFIGRFVFNEEGKFVFIEEYYDPAIVVKLFADNPDVYNADLWSTSIGADSK